MSSAPTVTWGKLIAGCTYSDVVDFSARLGFAEGRRYKIAAVKAWTI
jgi:hypothetical protein